jgi:GT2 family glycosyltransferase
MEMYRPLFSIIVPTYSRPQELASCLHALANLQYPRDCYEVIIVDDGSEKPAKDVVQAFYRKMKMVVIYQPNAGPAAARNAGSELATGQFLAFTDDDCVPACNWLQALASRFLTHPDCIIGGRTSNLLTNNLYSVTSQLITDVVYRHYNADSNQARFFASNNLALSRHHFLNLGGFDTNFNTAEDREFCDRWLSCGFNMIYAPEAVVYHAHNLNFRKFLKQHFNYGRGAYNFQKVKARRGSGSLYSDLRFHVNVRNWLLYPFGQVKGRQLLQLAILLAVWQTSNLVGFLWEGFRQTIGKYDYPN